MADVHQLHETMVIIASQALGGKSKTPTADPSTAPKTHEELEARMTRVLG